MNKHYRFRGGQMPRSSAEERAAKAYRAGGKRPAPPAFLGKEAAATWRKIVAAKPLGWFDEGNLPLLALYCATLEQARLVAARVGATGVSDKGAHGLEIRLMGLNGSCVTLASKLRLTVQAAVNRHSRMLDERGPGEAAASDPLLGGKVIPLHNRGRRT